VEIQEDRGSNASSRVSDGTIVRKCIATCPPVPGRAIDGRLARTILRARRGTSSLLASRSFCWPPIILFLHTTRQRVHCPRRGDRSGATVEGTALRRHFVDYCAGFGTPIDCRAGPVAISPGSRMAGRAGGHCSPCADWFRSIYVARFLSRRARSTAPAYPPADRLYADRGRAAPAATARGDGAGHWIETLRVDAGPVERRSAQPLSLGPSHPSIELPKVENS
jgi:hypothetical protein